MRSGSDFAAIYGSNRDRDHAQALQLFVGVYDCHESRRQGRRCKTRRDRLELTGPCDCNEARIRRPRREGGGRFRRYSLYQDADSDGYELHRRIHLQSRCHGPVSYTHLDVYKRQRVSSARSRSNGISCKSSGGTLRTKSMTSRLKTNASM